VIGPKGLMSTPWLRPFASPLAKSAHFFLFRGLTTKPGQAFPSVGTPAPAFTLVSATGTAHVGTPANGGASGKPVALLFFGSWCSLCHSELPPLAAAVHHQQLGSSPLNKLAVIGVDSIESPSQAAAFAASSGVTFPVGSDSDARVTASVYGFTGDPYAVFVSGSEKILAIHRGGSPASGAGVRNLHGSDVSEVAIGSRLLVAFKRGANNLHRAGTIHQS